MYDVLKIEVFDGTGEIVLNTTNEDATDRLSDCIVMQFTGLLDAKGKEIYEGDILEGPRPYPDSSHRYVVKYGDGAYHAGFNLTEGHCKHLTVIGNIYEHPDIKHAYSKK